MFQGLGSLAFRKSMTASLFSFSNGGGNSFDRPQVHTTTYLGPILQNFFSAEKFSEKFSPSNL
jgi:hypothetical protein